jgi:hypothetical protein
MELKAGPTSGRIVSKAVNATAAKAKVTTAAIVQSKICDLGILCGTVRRFRSCSSAAADA